MLRPRPGARLRRICALASRSEGPQAGAGDCRRTWPSGFHGPGDDLDRDVQTQTVRVEYHIVVVRVRGGHSVHGSIEVGTTAIQVSGRPSRRPDRHTHPLGQSQGANA